MKNIEKYLRENGYADRGLNEKLELRFHVFQGI